MTEQMMRFILRIIGTWLLGMTLILLIMDGTKSLAASNVVITGLGDVWILVHESSLIWLEQIFGQKGYLEIIWRYGIAPVLSWPGWAVLGFPGLVLIFHGQSRARHR